MKNKILSYSLLAVGALLCLWAFVGITSALLASGSISALVASYMSATGLSASFATLVNYYTYIKGIEYIICASFFVIFPIFYKFVNTEKVPAKVIA